MLSFDKECVTSMTLYEALLPPHLAKSLGLSLLHSVQLKVAFATKE
eukprot:SAG31_NODE_4781_length_2958_cov_1.822665_1_plen_45_part_10